MEMFYCPDVLKNLAIEAIGKHVSEIFLQLVRYSVDTGESLTTRNYVKEACRQFHENFNSMVPHTVANEVTIKLLRYVDLTYQSMCMSDVECDLEFITTEIVSAIIHPRVMRLDFQEYSTHPNLLDRYKIKTPPFIYFSLRNLKNLEVLNLGVPFENINGDWDLSYVPKSLKRFSSWVCSDKDINLLAKSCRGLESLDFMMSAFVSDRSLKFVVKFRNLKELNLSGTMITQRGLTWILNALCFASGADNGDNCKSLSKQLVSLAFNYPAQSHINLLVIEFPNLRSLRLSLGRRKVHLTCLRDLKYLSKLNLRYFGVPKEEEIKCIGPQLKCLDIALHRLSELKWIYNYCPGLQCLHLYFRIPFEPQSELMAYFEKYPLPEFRSVQSFQLILFNQDITDYIVSRFVNIKKLYIFHDGMDSLFESIVLRKQLRHLEQFFWGDKTVVEFSGDRATVTTFNGGGSKVHSTEMCNSSFSAFE
jgi:hypothetical protein